MTASATPATALESAGPKIEGQRGFFARYPLVRYILVRLVVSVVLLWGVTLVTFVFTNLVPSNPAQAALGDRAASDPAVVAQFNHEYGLDRPVWVQYGVYLSHLLHGDLGRSTQTHQPVAADLATVFPATVELAVVAVIIAALLGILLGLHAALHQRSPVDQLIRVVSLIGVSTPTFWMALVIYFLLFYKLNLFPGSGRLDPALVPPPQVTGFYTVDALIAGQSHVFINAVQHLVLPSLVLVIYNLGYLARFTRSSVLDVLGNDYVTTARAKGLPAHAVTGRYILRGALVPILTIVGISFGGVLSGAVLTETVFSWGGLGQYAYKASTTLDLQAVMGVGVVVGAVFVGVNFVVDLLYGLIDPRVRVG
ncbi:ABC transporter permease [Microlunatus soli]|uniref:Peptide/nickel transport system permease protein n=1 Tax=Microlunatus soli TaxID=630515 RepID=A0A1H1RE62_9ACTN|nr:ABC transporter permease [Microlunatus soli]SDS33975.1 peptide/nickel transport system permease protein [Microlunatus soli]